jgi:uroporphyrinogen-III synthase
VHKAKVKVAAIGPATALVAGEAGFEVSFMPKGGTGEDFASEFSEILSSDESVFHPVSAAAKSPLSKIADKCSYVSAAVYKNAACEKVEDDVVGDADMVVFTCPSSVERTPLRKECRAVVIGETTLKSALSAGWENVIVASSPSVQGIVDALLLNFLTKKQMEVK